MDLITTLRIATRKSKLALWQAEHVGERLQAIYPALSIELVPITTVGDRVMDKPLAKIGGKGLFIKELQQALLERRADIAVHSMKDVPIEAIERLHIPVVLERADPRDALVSAGAGEFATLAPGSTVGTSSLRRKSQLAALRPDLQFVDLRGNVTTRLEHVAAGRFDAIVLAAAGLKRLSLDGRIGDYFSVEAVVPAVGQGVIGVECRVDDDRVNRLIADLNDPASATRVTAERAMSRTLAGSCEIPLAAHASINNNVLSLTGLVASLDGSKIIRESSSGRIEDASGLGVVVAERLLARGAKALIDEAVAAQAP